MVPDACRIVSFTGKRGSIGEDGAWVGLCVDSP
jgi:hypothetical protein